MRVLVTRPEDDARETAARLKALGHVPIVAPLISIRFIDGPDISLKGVQGLIVTSANGVRALARRTSRRDISLFAVGRQTAATAQHFGFTRVQSADGDAVALAGLVVESATLGGGRLVHATGLEAPGTLVDQLSQKGFDVRREVLYETPAIAPLPIAATAALRSNALDVVLLFSRRTSRIFCERVGEAGLVGPCTNVIAACISSATAEGLSRLKFQEIRIAPAPNQDALLALLG